MKPACVIRQGAGFPLYLKKGRLTAVEGRIQVRNYENNEGKRVYVTEIIADNVRFLESASGGSGSGGSGGSSTERGGNSGSRSGGQGSNRGQGSGSNDGGSQGGNSGGRDPFANEGRKSLLADTNQSCLVALPILVTYPFLQKYVVHGVQLGSVKEQPPFIDSSKNEISTQKC